MGTISKAPPQALIIDTTDLIRQSFTPVVKRVRVTEDGLERSIQVTRQGLGVVKNTVGTFWLYDFYLSDKWEHYSVLWKGNIDKDFLPIITKDSLILSINSGCEPGHVFGDHACSCHENLLKSIRHVHKAGEGMVVYIPQQEAQGRGLAFKLTTLQLQYFNGMDASDAERLLTNGSEVDVRSYFGIIALLKFLGIEEDVEIALGTNNYKKVKSFKENDYSLCVKPF